MFNETNITQKNFKMNKNDDAIIVDDIFQQLSQVHDNVVKHVFGEGEEIDFNVREIGVAGELMIDLERHHHYISNSTVSICLVCGIIL
jgi:hypothetical protein